MARVMPGSAAVPSLFHQSSAFSIQASAVVAATMMSSGWARAIRSIDRAKRALRDRLAPE